MEGKHYDGHGVVYKPGQGHNCCNDCWLNWAVMKGPKKWVAPSRFEAVADTALCSGCENCIERTSIGLKCIACDASYTVAGADTIDTPCPQCGQKNGRLISKHEYYITNMQVL